MSVLLTSAERKASLYAKTQELFSTHNNYMLVSLKRVKAVQLKESKCTLDPKVKLLFGKNKIMKKALIDLDSSKYSDLLVHLCGNVIVLFFDNVDPKSILDCFNSHLKKALALGGDIAPIDVVIPAGPTGLGPEKIKIFQSARINTKIVKDKIDLVSEHRLISTGEVVSIANSSLLKMLGILPFEFGLDILRCYESGEIYNKEVLNIKPEVVEDSIRECISSISAISLATGVTTVASVSYEIKNAFADIAAISFGSGFGIKELSN